MQHRACQPTLHSLRWYMHQLARMLPWAPYQEPPYCPGEKQEMPVSAMPPLICQFHKHILPSKPKKADGQQKQGHLRRRNGEVLPIQVVSIFKPYCCTDKQSSLLLESSYQCHLNLKQYHFTYFLDDVFLLPQSLGYSKNVNKTAAWQRASSTKMLDTYSTARHIFYNQSLLHSQLFPFRSCHAAD